VNNSASCSGSSLRSEIGHLIKNGKGEGFGICESGLTQLCWRFWLAVNGKMVKTRYWVIIWPYFRLKALLPARLTIGELLADADAFVAIIAQPRRLQSYDRSIFSAIGRLCWQNNDGCVSLLALVLAYGDALKISSRKQITQN
jgi:hypothetical protein